MSVPSDARPAQTVQSPQRARRRLVWAQAIPVALVAAMLLIPSLTKDLGTIALVPTFIVGILGTFHVWLMLRVDLLSFASPPFMAVGGYSMALMAIHVSPNALWVVPVAFLVPALVALLLGALLLRLRGTYFALVTFALAQVVVLVIGLNTSVLGGTSGLVEVPAVTVGGRDFAVGVELLYFSVVVGVVGVAIAVAVSYRHRRAFAAIHANEALASSLGLRPWVYKTMAFSVSAGVAGLAGLVVVNQLAVAQPDTFAPLSSVAHVTGAVLGGISTAVGPVVGAVVLAFIDHEFATQADFSQLLLGITLILVVSFAKNGISDLLRQATRAVTSRVHRATAASATLPAAVSALREHPSQELAPRTSVPSDVTLLEVDRLSRRFGGLKAVDNLSFSLPRGGVLGVIGPNGAGKTTLISMLAGALAPSSGQVRLESKNIEGRPSYNVARRGVGRSFQQTATFGNETVGENLARALVFSRRSSFDGGFHALIASTGLLDVLDSRSADLPYGKQKLLGLLMTVATRPRLLLMDEPAAGLETSERLLIDRIVDLVVSDGTAVLLVEHDMDLVKRICPRVIVMDAGALLAEGPPEDVFRDLNVISAYLGTPPEDPVLDTVLGEGGHL